PASPLAAIDWPEIAVFVGPLVPDLHPPLLQPAHIGVPAQEPEQLINDGADMELFGGEQRKAVGEIEPHLIAENRPRSGAGPVRPVGPVLHHMPHQIEILLHVVFNIVIRAPITRTITTWAFSSGRLPPI